MVKLQVNPGAALFAAGAPSYPFSGASKPRGAGTHPTDLRRKVMRPHPASRSTIFGLRHKKLKLQCYTAGCARVAELVDAHGSGPCIARCGDSSSLPGTRDIQTSESWQNKGRCRSSGLFPFRPLLNRYRHQVMALCADDPGLGKFPDLQRLADFFGRQQFHDAINLGRIGIASAHAAFSPQAGG